MKATHILIFIAVALGAIETAPQSWQTSMKGSDSSSILARRAVVASNPVGQDRLIAKALCPIWTIWQRGVQELSDQRSFERGEPRREVAI